MNSEHKSTDDVEAPPTADEVDECTADPGLNEAIRQFQLAAGKNGPDDVSPKARTAVLALQADYLKDLLIGAAIHARRTGSDQVSASHVTASDHLLRIPRLSWATRMASGLGGILTGAGLSTFASVLMGQSGGTGAYVYSFATTVVGAVLLSIAALRGR